MRAFKTLSDQQLEHSLMLQKHQLGFDSGDQSQGPVRALMAGRLMPTQQVASGRWLADLACAMHAFPHMSV
eukprot:363640-Chlamydomonas_euryale.AAC.1